MRKPPKQTVTTTPWWYSWRHVAAYIYLFICAFDFVLMPVYYEVFHKPLSKTQLVSLVATMDPTNQVQAMQIISTEQRWVPLTLGESGLFHLAFGAILGVAAFSRTMERRGGIGGHFDEPYVGTQCNDPPYGDPTFSDPPMGGREPRFDRGGPDA